MSERLHPNVVYTRNSPNQSSRSGVKPRTIVIHSTESHNRPGNSDLQSIADYLSQSGVDASAHVVTDADGNSARIVPDDAKAWHVVAFNSQSLGVEQIGQAAQGSWAKAERNETARWVAAWSIKYGIPIRRAKSSNNWTGVTTHRALGASGGGHWDPGYSYPFRRMLRKARHYKRVMRRNRG